MRRRGKNKKEAAQQSTTKRRNKARQQAVILGQSMEGEDEGEGRRAHPVEGDAESLV